MLKDIWLRQYMNKHKLYLKESITDPLHHIDLIDNKPCTSEYEKDSTKVSNLDKEELGEIARLARKLGSKKFESFFLEQAGIIDSKRNS